LSCYAAGSYFFGSCVGSAGVLSLVEGHLWGGTKVSFLRDVETQVRFLLSLPVLILAEVAVHRRLGPVIKRFIERRIVGPEKLPKFYAMVDSAIRMRNSVIAEIVPLVLVFTGGFVCGLRKNVIQQAGSLRPRPSRRSEISGLVLCASCWF
jgi:hypothetical protein